MAKGLDKKKDVKKPKKSIKEKKQQKTYLIRHTTSS